MKALLLLLFAGIPLAATAGDREYEGEYSYERIQPIHEWVCERFESDYEDFDCPPQPVVALVETERGLWGYYYRGSQIVWVSTRLADQPLSVFGEAIIAHEGVHYVLSMIDDLQEYKDACRNEAYAWDIYNEYVLSYGFEDLMVEKWWDSYPRCDGPDVDPRRSIWELIQGLEPSVSSDIVQRPSELL